MNLKEIVDPLIQGGAIVALAWVLTLLVGGKLHTSSEVAGLRQDKADLLMVNERLSDALKHSNELLEIAVRRG